MGDLLGERYEPLDVVASGDECELVRALDHLSGRTVALKVRHLASATEQDALMAETRGLVDLPAHPNLPAVRDVFAQDDSCCLVTEWVDGVDLRRVLTAEGGPGLPFDRVLGYLEQAAAALEHLHRQVPPVVHRHVRPSRLILKGDGDVVLVGFGISARWTPRRPAPDDVATPAADVRGLASAGHVLLTGSPPVPGARRTVGGLTDAEAEGVLRTLDRFLAVDAHNPASASAFVQELRSSASTVMLPPDDPPEVAGGARAGAGQVGPGQVEAGQAPEPAAEAPAPGAEAATVRSNRLRGWVAVVLAALLGVTLLQVRTAQAERNQSRRLQLASLAQALAARVDGEVRAGRHERAALLARQAHVFDQLAGTATADVDQALRRALTAPNFGRALAGSPGAVWSVAFNPDGTRLATGGPSLRLIDTGPPGAPALHMAGHPGPVPAVAFSPDGQTLAAAGRDGKVRLWDLSRTGTAPAVLQGHSERLTSVAFGPDGRHLASAGADGIVRLWDRTVTPPAVSVLNGHTGAVAALAFSADGARLASAGADGNVRMWDVAQPGVVATQVAGGPVRAVALSPDGRWLAAGGDDPAVLVWDLAQPGVARTLTGHTGIIHSLAFSPDGRHLASGSEDTTIRLWAADGAAPPAVLAGHNGPVFSVAFRPDGQVLASGSHDRTARLWSLSEPATADLARSRPVPTSALAGLVCDQVGRNLTSAEWKRFVGPAFGYRRTCPDLPPG